MRNPLDAQDLTCGCPNSYDAPELTDIGDAGRVIMGMPGGGFDGAYGMTEPPFEFELDEVEP